jgi:hypothetical protein
MPTLLLALVPLLLPLSVTNDHEDWPSLDREIEALSDSLSQAAPGPRISGWVRARHADSSELDVDATTPGGQDLGGFNLDDARVVVSGEVDGRFAYTLSFEGGDPEVSDAAGSGFALLDAYSSVKLGDRVAVSVGRFSATFLWSSGIEDRRLLFLDRAFLGEAWDGRDVGLEFSGSIGRFDWWAAVQNGSDRAADGQALSARVSCRALGTDLCTSEGCCELGDEEHLTIGLAWFDDTSLDEGEAVCADLLFATGRWSSIVEIVGFQENLRPAPGRNRSTGALIPSGSSVTGPETPWDASLGYMLVPDEWELAARWQDLDDDAGTTVLSAVLDRYFAGHDAKWTLQIDSSRSEDPALEGNTVALGLTVGF